MTEPEFMLAMWREAGRHADAVESIPMLGKLLAEQLPVSGLRLEERSRERAALVVLGSWDADGSLASTSQHHECSPTALAALGRWALRGQAQERDAGQRWTPVLAGIDPTTDRQPWIALPLVSGEQFIGIAFLRLACELDESEHALLRAATAPLAAVVDNDFRLREISQLRERAEAERDSLLSRLGRESVNEAVIGADQGLRKVLERVEQVARSDATVLLLGETGSGKEVIARTIHERSVRREGPFIRVNCGAVAPELIDSELFGHERGAFTGALATRRGWFERADGGTLFLDEIGELAPPVQVRLLRVLQDHVIQRVGGEQEHAVDARVVAATHRNLPDLVQEGRFREDLWYRVAVFPIILPPLRERPDDIPELATHFVQRAARRAGLHAPRIDAAAIELLQSYSWPGNVRELGSVLERAVILGQGKRLEVAAALGVTAALPGSRGVVPLAVNALQGPMLTLDEATARHIADVLARCEGRIEGKNGAARALGINPSTLRSRMRKLGLGRSVVGPSPRS